MYISLSVLILFFTSHLFAKDYFLFKKEERLKIETIVMSGKEVNTLCKKLNSQCKALKVDSTLIKHIPVTNFTNPVSQKCLFYKGKPIILLDQSRNEYNFCLFGDKSMIKSRDLGAVKSE